MSKRKVTFHHDAVYDRSAPLIATFRNGPPPLNDVNGEEFAFEMYENPQKKQRLLVSTTKKMAYQAANFGYHSAANDNCSYVVGIYDKNTGEVRLSNIDQIYVLQQTVKGARADEDSAGQEETRNYNDKKRDLVEVFGSKKSKRIVKSREENVVDLQNITGVTSVTQTLKQKISRAASDNASQAKESAALAATRNAILPPCNADAPSPDRIYDLHKFLNTECMESLRFKAQELVEAIEASSSVSEYILSNNLSAVASRVLTNTPTPYDMEKLSCLVYFNYLLTFTRTHFPIRKSITALSESSDIPLVVLRQILGTFCEQLPAANGSMSFTQSKTMKDKLYLYLLVVALTMSGFSLEVSEIAGDLKKSTVVMTNYFRQLGCSITKTKSEQSVYTANAISSKKTASIRAVLSLPLRFPAPKKGSGPRR